MLARRQAQPGAKLAAIGKDFGIRHRRGQCARRHWSNPEHFTAVPCHGSLGLTNSAIKMPGQIVVDKMKWAALQVATLFR